MRSRSLSFGEGWGEAFNFYKMTHLDTEITRLKEELNEMMNLTISQIKKTFDALSRNEKDLAREVVFYEKRVNSLELKIDRDCENTLALLSPVATDLRFVLSVLKINSHLERIADNAEGISRYITEDKMSNEISLFKNCGLDKMFTVCLDMLRDVANAFDNEDASIARTVFSKDDILDQINRSASDIATEFIRANPDKISEALFILSTVRKLERVGDLATNIAEEIIFYIEAKVLKHKS